MVFGEVVSGQEIVTHVEGLPVDRMSRPLQDAKVVNCGELVLKLKSKGTIAIYCTNREKKLFSGNYIIMCIYSKKTRSKTK